MIYRKPQVGDAGFELIHETGNPAFLLPAAVGNDTCCKLTCNRATGRLIGRLHPRLELRPYLSDQSDRGRPVAYDQRRIGKIRRRQGHASSCFQKRPLSRLVEGTRPTNAPFNTRASLAACACFQCRNCPGGIRPHGSTPLATRNAIHENYVCVQSRPPSSKLNGGGRSPRR